MQGKNGGGFFRRRRGPQNQKPEKPQEYVPQRATTKPRGYAEIDNVSQLPHDAPEWQDFLRDVVQMPPEMLPAVQEAIRLQKWKIAPNPVGAIRTAAHQEARRMGIDSKPLPPPPGS